MINYTVRPRVEPTFFYSDNCPHCMPALSALVPLFADMDIRLIIRKPNVAELKTPGFRFPALFIPAGFLGLDQPTLIVGAGIVEQVNKLIEKTKSPSN